MILPFSMGKNPSSCIWVQGGGGNGQARLRAKVRTTADAYHSPSLTLRPSHPIASAPPPPGPYHQAPLQLRLNSLLGTAHMETLSPTKPISNGAALTTEMLCGQAGAVLPRALCSRGNGARVVSDILEAVLVWGKVPGSGGKEAGFRGRK